MGIVVQQFTRFVNICIGTQLVAGSWWYSFDAYFFSQYIFNSFYTLLCSIFGLGTKIEYFTLKHLFIPNGIYYPINNIVYVSKTPQVFFAAFKKRKRFIVETAGNQFGIHFFGTFSGSINGIES